MQLAALFILCFSTQTGFEPKDLPVGPGPTGFLSYSFSPDSKKILYSKIDDAVNFDPQKREIWIANSDGANQELVTRGVGACEWTRDGSAITYFKSTPNGTDLCLFDLATKKEKSLGIRLFVRSAQCSPVEDRLVLAADLGNATVQMFTCTLDGKDMRQVTFGPGKAFNPLWSPDGKRIVFYRELGDGKDQIYLINSDGTQIRHLSDSKSHNFFPDFGPRGLVSYTVAMSEQNKRVVMCNADGKQRFEFPYRTSRLRWSRDGKKAIFAAGEFTKSALYVCDADGGHLKRIGENPLTTSQEIMEPFSGATTSL